MKLDFLILYEHIVRELDSDCLLAAELQRRGFRVELFQLMSRKKIRYFWRKKPKVIITSAMYDNDTLNSFVYNNVGKLNKIINLHWEEVLSREQEESDFYSLKQNAAKCIHICWGEAAKQRIIEHGVKQGNAVVTGAIHLDFLNQRFFGSSKSKPQLAQEFDIDISKNWILYISSFSCASMDEGEIGELNEMTNLDFTGFKQVGARSMTKTLDWFDRLLTDRPENILIYRPHPSEWESKELSEMKRRHPGMFKVVSDHTVREWVLACDDIFTWMSTSISEIFYAEKSCIILRPEPLYDDYDPVIYKGCDSVDCYDELLKRFDDKKRKFPIKPELIKAHYSVIEDCPSYMRIADLCEEVYCNPPRDIPFSEGYTPHFNLLKFVSLAALNLMVSLRINPDNFRWLAGKKIVSRTKRLIGYIEKSRVSRKTIKIKIEEFGRLIS